MNLPLSASGAPLWRHVPPKQWRAADARTSAVRRSCRASPTSLVRRLRRALPRSIPMLTTLRLLPIPSGLARFRPGWSVRAAWPVVRRSRLRGSHGLGFAIRPRPAFSTRPERLHTWPLRPARWRLAVPAHSAVCRWKAPSCRPCGRTATTGAAPGSGAWPTRMDLWPRVEMEHARALGFDWR